MNISIKLYAFILLYTLCTFSALFTKKTTSNPPVLQKVNHVVLYNICSLGVMEASGNTSL